MVIIFIFLISIGAANSCKNLLDQSNNAENKDDALTFLSRVSK